MSFLHSANCRKLTPQRLTCLKSALAKAPQPKMSIARLVRHHARLESSNSIATTDRRTTDFFSLPYNYGAIANGIPGVIAHEVERFRLGRTAGIGPRNPRLHAGSIVGKGGAQGLW